MNRIKILITAVMLIICVASLNVYAIEGLMENETPPLPFFTDENEDTGSDSDDADNPTSKPDDSDDNAEDDVVSDDKDNGNSGGFFEATIVTKPSTNTSTQQAPVQQLPVQEENDDTMTFADVKQDDWFYNDVMFVFNNKIMTGTGENEFSPNTTLNRAMMITILHRIDGDDLTHEKNIFSDVEKNSWYENAVSWGFANKIVSGTSESTFSPMDNLTREQLCVMLYNYTTYSGIKTEYADISAYNDYSTVSEWAKNAVCWAVETKLITGKDNNTLAPADSATRAEASAVIRRYIEKFSESEEKYND